MIEDKFQTLIINIVGNNISSEQYREISFLLNKLCNKIDEFLSM